MERILKDPPCSSIPDANHPEDSKPPHNKKQNGSSFLGDLNDDVNESFEAGGLIWILSFTINFLHKGNYQT